MKICPITGFEPVTSSIGSGYSANWATTTAQPFHVFKRLESDNSCQMRLEQKLFWSWHFLPTLKQANKQREKMNVILLFPT